MADWTAFAGILIVQGLVLAVVHVIKPKVAMFKLLALAGGSGVVLGLLFDLLIGDRFGVFGYHLTSTLFYLLNGAFSYGLAIATALVVSPPPIKLDPGRRGVAIGLTAVGGAIAVALMLSGALPPLWAIGATVIAIGEFAEATIVGTAGPFLDAWYGRIGRSFNYWFKSIAIGAIYEAANTLLPVWIWSFNRPAWSLSDELVVVVFGYVVLLHACRIVGLLALDFVDRAIARSS